MRRDSGIARPLGSEWIALIVQNALRAIGRDPQGFSSHSLRSGLVTAAGENGIGDLIIAGHTGHQDLKMVRRYFRRRDLFRRNVVSMLDL
jgi:integrase